MKKYLVPCVLICLSWLQLLAQQPAYFMLGEEQFEGVQIYDVIQDQQSNYWFATDEGIIKHDGYSYTRIDCPDLVGRAVFGFVINEAGTIYCHTLNHQIVQIRDGQCEVIYELINAERSSDIHLFITPGNELLVIAGQAMLIDTAGQVRRNPAGGSYYYGRPFLTQDGRIISHLSSHDSLLQVSHGEFKFVPLHGREATSEAVLVFFRMKENVFAINLKFKTLYAFDEKTLALTRLPDKSFLATTEPMRFYNELDHLWITGSSAGVRLLSDPRRQQSAAVMYPQYFISNAFLDREGNMLLCTFDHGVIVIPDMQIPDVMAIPDGQKVTGLRRDRDIGVMIGTDRGQLLQVSGETFTTMNQQGTKPLVSIFAWENCPLIVFDDGGIKAYDKRTHRTHEIAQGSLKDAEFVAPHTFYLSLNIGMREVDWDGENEFDVQILDSMRMRTYAVEADPTTGALYIATADGLKKRSANGKIQDIDFAGARIFASDIVAHAGKIYVASKSQGLLILDENGKIQQLRPTIAGQPLDITKLEFVGDLAYAATSAGFLAIGKNGQITTLLNKANGFSSNKVRDFAWHNGELWLLHAKGLQRLHSTQLIHHNFQPKIEITEVNVNDVPLANLQVPGDFDHTQRKIRFRLSSPTLRHRENIVYHYRLIGYDNVWSTASYRDNLVVYNALAPGSYSFQVQAENHGALSAIASYSFKISAPLYARAWFIALSVLALLAGTVLIYRRQLAVQHRKTQLLNELNLSRLTAIQSQMNPHFIFNALNSIQDLVLRGDIDNSYTFITKFANLVRRTLNYSDKDFIEIEQELELLQLYLSLEKLRFKDDFTFTLEAEDIEDIQVPPMLIQPFIENALVHGLIHKSGPKRLNVRLELQETLICTIEDNGIGREKAREIKARQRAASESFSGAAIRKRFSILNAHFEGKLGFEYEDLIEDGVPSGTRVTLQIPVKRRF